MGGSDPFNPVKLTIASLNEFKRRQVVSNDWRQVMRSENGRLLQSGDIFYVDSLTFEDANKMEIMLDIQWAVVNIASMCAAGEKFDQLQDPYDPEGGFQKMLGRKQELEKLIREQRDEYYKLRIAASHRFLSREESPARESLHGGDSPGGDSGVLRTIQWPRSPRTPLEKSSKRTTMAGSWAEPSQSPTRPDIGQASLLKENSPLTTRAEETEVGEEVWEEVGVEKVEEEQLKASSKRKDFQANLSHFI
ncbi:hypothetical protein CDD81_4894 [Ophiocordyceps australis]|uniref:Uncharacterized protein n=1 Tax=Ophiocordyceps australis TaxID=1399860 RepID=A0A2C5Y626_9HYPO|nr:hypothetical protein CDD81_4894 [Ophiocordyceps australis]